MGLEDLKREYPVIGQGWETGPLDLRSGEEIFADVLARFASGARVNVPGVDDELGTVLQVNRPDQYGDVYVVVSWDSGDLARPDLCIPEELELAR